MDLSNEEEIKKLMETIKSQTGYLFEKKTKFVFKNDRQIKAIKKND